MARVRFTDNIQRHVSCPEETIDGESVRIVLDGYFQRHPRARGYVLNDRGALRKHMAVFLDGRPIDDRAALSDAVHDNATIDVMQALSGG